MRKDPFGGPCFEGTLQKPIGVSESSPVAGTIKSYQALCFFRCRTRTRVAEKRPASHTNALGSLFIADVCRKAQGGICGNRKFTKLVRHQHSTPGRLRRGRRSRRTIAAGTLLYRPLPLSHLSIDLRQGSHQAANVGGRGRLLIDEDHSAVAAAFFCPGLEKDGNCPAIVRD